MRRLGHHLAELYLTLIRSGSSVRRVRPQRVESGHWCGSPKTVRSTRRTLCPVRVLMLYPFRYRLERTGKCVKGRYVAEGHGIAERYAEWDILGPPEIRTNVDLHFDPWRRTGRLLDQAATVESSHSLLDDERSLVLLFLRRYVAYCARRRRFAQMEGA